PPWEKGADEIHFTVYQSMLAGITINDTIIAALLKQLHYPDAVAKSLIFDGPPEGNETLNRFTLRDAGLAWAKAAQSASGPPDLTFVWDFIALDGNPADMGADTQPVQAIVEEIDKDVAALIKTSHDVGWSGAVMTVLP